MKRFLSLLLAITMVVSMLPTIHADDLAESEELEISDVIEEEFSLVAEEPELLPVQVRIVCLEGADIEVRDAAAQKLAPISETELYTFLLVPGTYSLSVWAEGYAALENHPILVEAGAEEQTIHADLIPLETDAACEPTVDEVLEETAPEIEEPTEEETAPEIEEPVEEETAPEIEEPVEEETAPEVEEPVEEETIPEVEEPAEVETLPEVEEPAEEETVPEAEELVEETVPEIEEPAEEETVLEVEEPTEEETVPEIEEPVEEETVPEVEEPVEEETVPEVEEPVEEETVPEVEEPVEEETVPEVEEPVEEETAPEVEEPVEEETVPEVEEPAEEETVPEIEESVEEEIAPEIEEPAVEEETAPEVEEPAEEETVPEVEEPIEEETAPEVEEPVEEETVPEIEEPVEEETVPEVEEPVEEETVPEIEEPVEEETVPEVEEPTEEETVPEIEEPVEEETVPEVEEPVEEETVPEIEEPVEEETVPEIEEPAEEETVPEIEEPTEEETIPEIEEPVEEESVPEVEEPTEEETVEETLPEEPEELTFGSPADLVGVTDAYLQRHPWLQSVSLLADEPVPSESAAYSAMIAYMGSYPEGTPYTNDNYYEWNGGIFSGGYGCAGFAFMLSDAAFGKLPARKISPVSISALHVGDILRIYGDTHSVIVLEVHSDHVVIAEGNYNSSVHWGRTLTSADVAAANYYLTRYPVGNFTASYTVKFDANGGSNAPSAVKKGAGEPITLPADKPTRLFYEFLGWATKFNATVAEYLPGQSYNADGNATLYAVWQSESYPDLSLGQNSAVIGKQGGTASFRFVPPQTGKYTFESTGTKDAEAVLYLESGTILKADSDSGTNFNFRLCADLMAGNVYVLSVSYYSRSDTGTIPVNVTVEPDDNYLPTVLETVNTAKGVQVKWNPVEGAAKYRVFVKSGSGSWTTAADSTKTSCVVTGLTSGVMYTFMVRSLNAAGTYTSPAQETGMTIRYVAAPKVASVANTSSGVSVKWGAVSGAKAYLVLQRNSASEWEVVGKTTGTSYTVKGLTAGKDYTFSVRCAEKLSDTEYNPISAADPVGASIRYLSAPSQKTPVNKAGGVSLSWKAVPGAEVYLILQKTASGEWETIGQTTDTTYLVTGVTSGKDYTFTVCCGKKVSKTETEIASAYSKTGKTIRFIAAPKISSVYNTTKGVTVKWKAIPGAEMYRVFYKTGSGSWTTAACVETNSYTVTGLTSGVKYTFAVRCVSADGTKNVSSYYTSGKSITFVSAPKVESVTNTSKGVTVKWTAPKGAVNYKVMYKLGSGSWVKAGETTKTSFTVSGLTSGKKYSITVRAISADGTKNVSSYTSGKSLTVLKVPVISSVSKTATGVSVSWGKVTGAPKYRVYYKTGSGDWKKAGDTTSTSYTVKGLTSGTTYQFSVRCVSSDGKTMMGDRSGYKSLKYYAAPKISSVSNVQSGVTVKWSAVNGAVNYRVYYKTGTGDWIKAGDTTSTSYTVTGLKSGKTYSFTVRCISASGKTKLSAYNATGKSIQYIGIPKVSSVANTKNGVTVKWGAVSGAEKYRVYYKTGSGSWKTAGDTSSTSYTVKTLTSGKTYQFSVRCVSADGSKVLNSRSEAKSIEYIAAPVLKTVKNATEGVQLEWDAIPGAVKYIILFKQGTGKWTRCGEALVTSVVIPGLESGETYSFTVRCATQDGSTYTSGYNSDGKSIKYVAAPAISKIEPVSTGLKIRWKSVTGAKKYEVLYRTESTEWTHLTSTTSTSYTATGLTPGVPYSFAVRCVTTSGKAVSAFYEPGVTSSYVKKPSIMTLQCTSCGLVVNWTAVSGAAAYGVRLREAGGKWNELGMTLSASTSIYGLTAGKSYAISIVAYAEDGSSSVVDKTGVSIAYNPVQNPTDAQKDSLARVVAKGMADAVNAAAYKTDLEKVTAAAEMVYLYCLGAEYTMEGKDYRIPYGLFITGEYSCAGSTRALGLVLDYLGITWEHVNPNKDTHQWCRVVMDGKVGWADGMAGAAGYGKYLAE